MKDGEAKKPQPSGRKYEFIDLPEGDLTDKIGAYRMKNTKLIWKISSATGRLAVTDHLDATYQWRALSPARFRALDGPSKGTATLVFERESAGQSFTMRLDGDDGSKVDFEPVRAAKPNAKQLSEYAGRYYCAELQTTYSFSVREGDLFLQVNNHRHERLSPTVADEFIPSVRTPDDGRIITFVRDGAQRITGLAIDLWSIKEMTFERLAERER